MAASVPADESLRFVLTTDAAIPIYVYMHWYDLDECRQFAKRDRKRRLDGGKD